MNKPFLLHITEEEKAKLQKISNKQNRSMSGVVRALIEKEYNVEFPKNGK